MSPSSPACDAIARPRTSSAPTRAMVDDFITRGHERTRNQRRLRHDLAFGKGLARRGPGRGLDRRQRPEHLPADVVANDGDRVGRQRGSGRHVAQRSHVQRSHAHVGGQATDPSRPGRSPARTGRSVPGPPCGWTAPGRPSRWRRLPAASCSTGLVIVTSASPPNARRTASAATATATSTALLGDCAITGAPTPRQTATRIEDAGQVRGCPSRLSAQGCSPATASRPRCESPWSWLRTRADRGSC